MIKYYLYNKRGEVKAMSDGIIGYDKEILTLKKITTTKEQDNKIKQGYKLRYNRGLKFEEPEEMKNRLKIEDLKTEINEAKDIDSLKVVINKLI